MLKKFFFSFTLIVVLALIASTGFGQLRNQYDITISKPGVGWQIAPCPAPGTFGDTWRFINASPTVAIKVKVWNKDNTVDTYDIPASSNVIHTIAVGDCEIKVFDDTGAQELCECMGAYCGQTPTLTQWGVVALVVLLIGSTAFVMLRRKKAAMPA